MKLYNIDKYPLLAEYTSSKEVTGDEAVFLYERNWNEISLKIKKLKKDKALSEIEKIKVLISLHGANLFLAKK